MELFTDDGTFSGKGSVTGDAGNRRGRFLCESEPRSSSVLAGPLFIRQDEIQIRIKPIDHRFGGFWGMEITFEELSDAVVTRPLEDPIQLKQPAEQVGDGGAEEAV